MDEFEERLLRIEKGFKRFSISGQNANVSGHITTGYIINPGDGGGLITRAPGDNGGGGGGPGPGVVPGCMDPFADNYNPLATVDDGSCTRPPCHGCGFAFGGKVYLVKRVTVMRATLGRIAGTIHGSPPVQDCDNTYFDAVNCVETSQYDGILGSCDVTVTCFCDGAPGTSLTCRPEQPPGCTCNSTFIPSDPCNFTNPVSGAHGLDAWWGASASGGTGVFGVGIATSHIDGVVNGRGFSFDFTIIVSAPTGSELEGSTASRLTEYFRECIP